MRASHNRRPWPWDPAATRLGPQHVLFPSLPQVLGAHLLDCDAQVLHRRSPAAPWRFHLTARRPPPTTGPGGKPVLFPSLWWNELRRSLLLGKQVLCASR